MDTYLLIIIFILLFSYCLDTCATFLNVHAMDKHIPPEFIDVYCASDYAKSQDYTRASARLTILESTISTILTILFILAGGFNILDLFLRKLNLSELTTGLLFIGCLSCLAFLIELPFSVYRTFAIEERFGFNRTTWQTFILDLLKGLVLAVIFGIPLLAAILWFFANATTYAWIYSWLGLIVFLMMLQILGPVVILPMFNKFSPLEEGSLKDTLLDYASRVGFATKGIFTMDGSKRSVKANAFFIGIGKFKKIVLFDTIIAKLNVDQILAVLAHEIGHFKQKHVIVNLLLSCAQIGLMFFLLSFIIYNHDLSASLKMEHYSLYSGLIFFGFLFSPVSLLTSILFNYLSRKNEFAADKYAAITTGKKEHLISALKTLSTTNLSHLTPHWLTVLLHHGHPPVLQRIIKLQSIDTP